MRSRAERAHKRGSQYRGRHAGPIVRWIRSSCPDDGARRRQHHNLWCDVTCELCGLWYTLISATQCTTLQYNNKRNANRLHLLCISPWPSMHFLCKYNVIQFSMNWFFENNHIFWSNHFRFRSENINIVCKKLSYYFWIACFAFPLFVCNSLNY